MRRRAFLGGVGAATLAATAGCLNTTPRLSVEGATQSVHPARERWIDGGLESDGDATVYARAVGDEAPKLLGPDATGTVADRLRNPGGDQFHVVIQHRAPVDAPVSMRVPPAGPTWSGTDTETLRVAVERAVFATAPESLADADAAVTTGVWTLSPAVERPPQTVDVEFAETATPTPPE
ncbi:hypothetical protein RYH80_16820 [Halobaculum sp. MBLA0147]|uniref:hypothetical protein n=1 Tax=Halobaculum sp. MBLA0147 TaxID=3079934 RepID=UPI0035252282